MKPTDPVSQTPAAVPARRHTRTGWKDPRLWVGVGLVAVSVVAGARLLGAADDTVAVWAAQEDLVAGLPVGEGSFRAVDVQLGGGLEAYLRVDAGEPQGLVLRAVQAGELVPAAAVGAEAEQPLTSVSLEVATSRVPGAVVPGSRVDVWVLGASQAPATGDDTKAGTTRLLDDVLVLEAPTLESFGGVATTRQVVVGVPETVSQADLVRLLEAAGEDRVVLSGEQSP